MMPFSNVTELITHPVNNNKFTCRHSSSAEEASIDDFVHFDFVDPPPTETLMRALELLNGCSG